MHVNSKKTLGDAVEDLNVFFVTGHGPPAKVFGDHRGRDVYENEIGGVQRRSS